MHGGLIHVAGNAGHRIGAAYPGSKKGMTDGTILIGGDVGSEAGASMRRGTLVVGGSCGDARRFQHDRRQHPRVWIVRHPARCRHAAGDDRTLRHGTNQAAAHLPARRPLPAPFSPTALSRAGSDSASRSTKGCSQTELLLSHGDLVALGKGEVWMRTN